MRLREESLPLGGGCEGRIERALGGREVQSGQELPGFACAELAAHTAVFPFHGKGALIPDVVEGGDDLFPADVSAPQRAEIPVAALVAEGGMATKYADGAVPVPPPHVLHVHVMDEVLEGVEELDVVHALVGHMAGVEVEAKGVMLIHRVEGFPGGLGVEGHLRGVYFERELDFLRLKDVQDRHPAVGELPVACLNHLFGHGGEAVEEVPDRAAGEAVHHFDAQVFGGDGGVAHLCGRALVDILGGAVTPDALGENGLVAQVNGGADALADQMVADRPNVEAVFGQQFANTGTVAHAVRAGRLFDIEVAPAGQFQALVAPAGGLFRQNCELQVGPLAGEEGGGSETEVVSCSCDHDRCSFHERGDFGVSALGFLICWRHPG